MSNSYCMQKERQITPPLFSDLWLQGAAQLFGSILLLIPAAIPLQHLHQARQVSPYQFRPPFPSL